MYSSAQEKQFSKRSTNFLKNGVPAEEYSSLIELLTYHEWKYYVRTNPILSDKEYDTLYNALLEIEKSNPLIVRPDSPSQRVSSDLNPDFESVPHLTPMLSLGNSYNEEDLLDFDRQVKKLSAIEGAIEYNVEPKFDGGSLALVYENDLLIRAATRGNGQQGEEITPNAKALPSIPLKAAFSKHGIYKAELRGEAIIPISTFKNVNKKREKNGQKLFANPRNAAAGGLRMKIPQETRERGILVFIFQLSYAVDKNGNDVLGDLRSHSTQLDLLDSLGFKIPNNKERKVANKIEEVIKFSKTWEEKRDTYDYEIDGMVIKVNDLSIQQKIGYTQHHPRWAIAYKFKAKQATTSLLDVEFQVGKVGSITPVAKVEPKQLAGVTISSISLHNEDFILQKDLRIGDKILIERAGDVIPYIVKSFPELRTGEEKEIFFPSHCPVNHTDKSVELVKSEGEAAWRCPHCVCGLQNIQKIIFHVSKDAMDIDGFGKSYVEKFHQLGWINDVSDVYNLNYNEIAELEGFGKKSADNLKSAIEKAKQNPIQKLLHSLSIHHLGKKASKLIAQEINHVLDLSNWTEEMFTEIKDIGPVVAKNVIEYFSIDDNILLLQRMESLGVNLAQLEEDKPIEVADDAPLKEKTILFTGTLQKMKRNEAKEMAEFAGAKCISAVSSKLSILVVGEKAGSKLKKAQELGTVQIMTEDEFLELINGG